MMALLHRACTGCVPYPCGPKNTNKWHATLCALRRNMGINTIVPFFHCDNIDVHPRVMMSGV